MRMNTDSCKDAITVDRAWKLSKCWKRHAIAWRFLDHFFALGSFAASITTVYLAGEATSDYHQHIIVLSSISAFLSMSGFACNPKKYMIGYRKAFQVLNYALLEHTDEHGKFRSLSRGRDAVIRAIQKGEVYISDTYEVDISKDRAVVKPSVEAYRGFTGEKYRKKNSRRRKKMNRFNSDR